MNGTVPTTSLLFMVIALVISIALPLGLGIYFRKAKRADILPFFIGCAVMILFAFVLESFVHQAVFRSPVGETIQNTTWMYALYGGAMAALFEETGRLLAFRTVLRKNRNNDANALMYGAGHGGIEALVILGITSLNNIIWSVLINTGNLSVLTGALTGDLLKQAEEAAQTLITTPSWHFLMGGVERILAVVLQISLSVLVWFAVKEKTYRRGYVIALLIHLAVDGVTVVLAQNGASLLLVELAVAVMAAVTALYAKKIWSRYSV